MEETRFGNIFWAGTEAAPAVDDRQSPREPARANFYGALYQARFSDDMDPGFTPRSRPPKASAFHDMLDETETRIRGNLSPIDASRKPRPAGVGAPGMGAPGVDPHALDGGYERTPSVGARPTYSKTRHVPGGGGGIHLGLPDPTDRPAVAQPKPGGGGQVPRRRNLPGYVYGQAGGQELPTFEAELLPPDATAPGDDGHPAPDNSNGLPDFDDDESAVDAVFEAARRYKHRKLISAVAGAAAGGYLGTRTERRRGMWGLLGAAAGGGLGYVLSSMWGPD